MKDTKDRKASRRDASAEQRVPPLERALFRFFFVSGACSLVCEVVWLRLAMAEFGVAAVLVSIVLSVFMAGLALGSWMAGRWATSRADVAVALPLRAYAAAELLIAVSALLVPAGFAVGRSLLAGAHAGLTWGSLAYYVLSGVCVAVVLLPFCFAMGTTFPLGMWAVRAADTRRGQHSFSYLYLANVLGAATGTFLSAFVLIELLGFRKTLFAAAAANAALALAAWRLSGRRTRQAPAAAPAPMAPPEAPAPAATVAGLLPLLFVTGFVSMAAEVIWVRQFRPYLGNMVYTFALVLGVYLLATFAGSRAYRRALARRRAVDAGPAWMLIGAACLVPLVLADPRLPVGDRFGAGVLRLVLGIVPFCALLGFVTPMLVDRWSQGRPERAGAAYAVNVFGCILGPLAAGFVLLPSIGPQWGLIAVAAPLLALCGREVARGSRRRWLAFGLVSAGSIALALLAVGYETMFPRGIVRRDHMATVIAAGEGRRKRLLVNGDGMTELTPITKMMAHLPLAMLRQEPVHGLSICFGMGTSFRSIHSWGIRATAIELVPSVPPLFGYFHEDAARIMASGRAEIVVDDGRRFLERTGGRFDVIVIDPPPPVEAAGSSLLYSKEFYALARGRLRPGGILQQWLPWGEPEILTAVMRALRESFPHLRVFQSVEGWGLHFLASTDAIASSSASDLAGRLPADAARDLIEWGPHATAEKQFQVVLESEADVERTLAQLPRVRALRDDDPVNEYFLLRRIGKKLTAARH